jgi:hypothetical protein
MSIEKDVLALKNTWMYWQDFQVQHTDIWKTPLSLKWYLRQNNDALVEMGAIAYENSRKVMIKPDLFFAARNKILESKPVRYLYPWRNRSEGMGV